MTELIVDALEVVDVDDEHRAHARIFTLQERSSRLNTARRLGTLVSSSVMASVRMRCLPRR